ncbi:MAG: hypothetical protein IKU29_11670, partial [Parabacteroides sp.]|nr:hypothetical protein [Parabacteroides sp.]
MNPRLVGNSKMVAMIKEITIVTPIINGIPTYKDACFFSFMVKHSYQYELFCVTENTLLHSLSLN